MLAALSVRSLYIRLALDTIVWIANINELIVRALIKRPLTRPVLAIDPIEYVHFMYKRGGQQA